MVLLWRKWCYVQMLTNTWVGSYWVGADGKWIPNYDPDVNANWVKSGNTWYYQRPDGSKLTNSWKRINGSWYYFGADGAMTTGWKYVDGYNFQLPAHKLDPDYCRLPNGTSHHNY